jgi:CheY-specific phosphatase CheX
MRMGEQRQQISEKYAQKILEINEWAAGNIIVNMRRNILNKRKNMRMGEQRQQISEKYAQKILEINEWAAEKIILTWP